MLTLLLTLASSQAAEPTDHSAILQVTTAVTYPISFAPLEPLPPSLAHGLGILAPIKSGWGYYNELGMATSFSTFAPALQIISGPTKKLNDGLIIGLTAMYKFVPIYADAPAPTHIGGGALVPIVPLSFGAISFPLGFAYNFSTRDPTIAANVKLAIRLP